MCSETVENIGCSTIETILIRFAQSLASVLFHTLIYLSNYFNFNSVVVKQKKIESRKLPVTTPSIQIANNLGERYVVDQKPVTQRIL